MVKIRRNLDTAESRAFWKNISRVREQIKQLPRWMQEVLVNRRRVGNMVRYISDGTWFDKGTEAKLVVDCTTKEHKMGIFCGIRTCQNSAAEAGKPVGTKYEDEECCGFDEFEVVEDEV